MACINPRVVVNPRYKKIAPKNHFFLYHDVHGQIPKKDYYISVGCGRCINCFKKYMSQWRFRLIHEILSLSKLSLSCSYYVTLTLENNYYTQNKAILKKLVRRFLDRCRKKYGSSVKHFLVTERGEDRNRIHFHGFFFECFHIPANDFYNLWGYGFVTIKSLASSENIYRDVSYTTSYVTKGKKGHIDYIIKPEDFPLVLVSPGLGKSYVDKYKFVHVRPDGTLFPHAFEFNGHLRSLPRYLRQKVFSESELKELKDNYFDNYSDDVIPDGPYYIGNRTFTDYTAYLEECKQILINYGK